tara:strand:+ start:258 stop:815 length:558 start_codon:yes stop_codon:yes gene_type:complete
MSTLKVDTILKRTGTGTITVGQSGDTVTIPSGATLNAAGSTSGSIGKILQVVQGSTTTEVSTTTSGSFTDTGLTASITPTSTSNKVLVLVAQHFMITRSSSLARAQVNVLRDSTTIFTPNNWTINMQQTGSDLAHSTMLAFNILDTPSSTSSLVYKSQMKPESSSTVKSQQNGNQSNIILMEVAG